MIEIIEESENEGNLITSNAQKSNDSIIKINDGFVRQDNSIKKNINKNNNLTFYIPESCSLSQNEFLLNNNNQVYKNFNGIKFKDDHTGNTLNTYESLDGKFFIIYYYFSKY